METPDGPVPEYLNIQGTKSNTVIKLKGLLMATAMQMRAPGGAPNMAKLVYAVQLVYSGSSVSIPMYNMKSARELVKVIISYLPLVLTIEPSEVQEHKKSRVVLKK